MSIMTVLRVQIWQSTLLKELLMCSNNVHIMNEMEDTIGNAGSNPDILFLSISGDLHLFLNSECLILHSSPP